MGRNDVRDDLIRAAERLFAECGSESVSLREITAAARATNASAIHYHFGDRSGLVRAILDKHRPAVEARRHALLDQYQAEGSPDLRALAGALVRPLAAEINDPDGGPGYLQLLADLVNRPRPTIDPASLDNPLDSTYRWRQLVEPLLSPEAVRLHRRFAAVRFTTAELARRARHSRRREDRLFVSELVDLVTGLLAAPVSAETCRLLPPARRGALKGLE